MKKLVIFALSFMASTAFAFDKATYKKIAQETIKEVLTGKVADVDALMKKQLKLVELGTKGCEEFAKTATGIEKKAVDLVLKHAAGMHKLSLEKIEADWHESGIFLKEKIDLNEEKHMGHANSLADAVIHPATAYIALKNYKSGKDKEEMLGQVKDELAEVLEHLKYIK